MTNADSGVTYIVKAACSDCGTVNDHVERFDDPVAVDQDITISATHCVACGAVPQYWDLHAEHRVEIVDEVADD